VNARLTKAERLCSNTLIDKLFEPGRGSKSITAYPIRAVYRLTEERGKTATEQEPANSILISVPKRQFKHAVDRNHVKRQIREAYRQNKHLLRPGDEQHTINVAFIWLDNRHYPTDVVRQKITNLLQRITESCAKS
jgi:ribonuclease P protein component